MTTRIRIICTLCLAAAITITIISAVFSAHIKASSNNRLPDSIQITPPQISVYFPNENKILLVSFDEFLTGCIRGMLPHGETPTHESLSVIAAAMKTKMLYHLDNRTAENSSQYYGADFAANDSFPYIPDNGDLALNEKLYQAAQYSRPLTINGSIFDCKLCRLSTGVTDPYPHCPSVLLLCDAEAYDSIGRYAFTAEEVWQAMGAVKAPSDCEQWFTNAVYEKTSSLRSIEFCSREISGEQLQKLFNLPSRAIIIEYTDDTFYFSCKGVGENMGLSVNAAVFLAKSGYSAEEIAAFFYPEAEYKSSYAY